MSNLFQAQTQAFSSERIDEDVQYGVGGTAAQQMGPHYSTVTVHSVLFKRSDS